MADRKEKSPKRVAVSDSAARLWTEEAAPVAAALHQLRMVLAAAEQRVVKRMAARDQRDPKRWALDAATMEWVELPAGQ